MLHPIQTPFKIVIVDDDSFFRGMVARTLKQQGYQVTIAENGQQALTVLADNLPDLVITDILMPEMDGLEFINQLRTSCFDFKIIAMTGGGEVLPSEDYSEMAIKLGAHAALLKPFPIAELISKVEELLSSNQSA